MSETKRHDEVETLERTSHKEKTEDLWRVVLHNDDYTPMDFVVDVLERIFDKSPAESYRIMMKVHVEGRGIAGIYTHEVAETKARTTVDDAREAGYPLLASVEEA
jgi:ATP-dependent Clp protease adaptor protein ClpS